MEEEKAAAYYEELTRKGQGAARFKQGLGFSANKDVAAPPPRGSALPSSTASFLSNFVKASSPTQASNLERQAQLESIQNKLKKKPKDEASERSRRESGHHRHRSRSRSRERNHRKRSRSKSRERNYRRRSRSRSRSRERYRDGERRRNRRLETRSRSRGLSPREGRRSEKRRGDDVERERAGKEKNGSIDYSRLIEGYEKMVWLGFFFFWNN